MGGASAGHKKGISGGWEELRLGHKKGIKGRWEELQLVTKKELVREGGASAGHKKGINGGWEELRLVTRKESLEDGRSFSWSQKRNHWRKAGD